MGVKSHNSDIEKGIKKEQKKKKAESKRGREKQKKKKRRNKQIVKHLKSMSNI